MGCFFLAESQSISFKYFLNQVMKDYFVLHEDLFSIIKVENRLHGHLADQVHQRYVVKHGFKGVVLHTNSDGTLTLTNTHGSHENTPRPVHKPSRARPLSPATVTMTSPSRSARTARTRARPGDARHALNLPNALAALGMLPQPAAPWPPRSVFSVAGASKSR